MLANVKRGHKSFSRFEEEGVPRCILGKYVCGQSEQLIRPNLEKHRREMLKQGRLTASDVKTKGNCFYTQHTNPHKHTQERVTLYNADAWMST